MCKIEKFQQGEALHQGDWKPVTTFLVVTGDGTEWCCLDGHHARRSRAVKREAAEIAAMLAEEKYDREMPCDGRHGIYCRGCHS